MTARLIDGFAFAERLRAEVARKTAVLQARHGLTPGLAVVLVGADPASEVYVRTKGKRTAEVGMRSQEIKLPQNTSGADLLQEIHRLNQDPLVHGVLVQMPLPKHIDAQAVIAALAPDKDVDGFHPFNVGRLSLGQPGLVPCTPKGCLMLLKDTLPSLAGLDAVVIGRSNIVGKPMAQLLLNADCTVTMAHSRSRNLPELCRRADILVVAIGRADFVRGDWVKPGAVVIDVGMNRIALPDGKTRLKGDVAFDEAAAVAGAITPVPRGVGPMTVACLLDNTLEAACRQAGVAVPD